MSVGEYCNREVAIAYQHTEVREAAKLMRKHHVGDLVVVDLVGEENIPVGVLTDRDIVIEVIAEDLDLDEITVGDIMSVDLVTARERDDLWDTLNRMRIQGIRRLPVVNDSGGLEGILTADDVLELFAEGLADIVSLVQREIGQEAEHRR